MGNGINILYDKGSTKKRYRSEPIDNTKVKVIMFGFGAVLVLAGFNINNLIVLLNGDPITKYVLAGLVFTGVILTFIELGIKKYTDFSKLKGFSNQQLITFGINMIILLWLIMNLSGYSTGFSVFAGGSLIVSGILIIFEVFR